MKKVSMKKGIYHITTLEELKDKRERYIFVWDFDGVFHLKPFHYIIDLDNIICREDLEKKNLEFRTGDILLTGRGQEQKEKILKYLRIKGYEFEKAIFRSFFDKLKWNLFWKKGYIKFKLKRLKKLNKKSQVCIVDDNLDVIRKCEENNIANILFSIKHNWIVL